MIMYMTRPTTQLITHGLTLIGEAGFSGLKIQADSKSAALYALLGPTAFTQADAQKLLTELTRQELAVVSHHEGYVSIQPTPKGLHRLQDARIKNLTIPTPDSWDGRWRMVMFDIPVRHNQRRTLFTRQLQKLRFTRLRDSTWVYPYACFPQLDELARHHKVQQFVTYAEICSLDSGSSAKLRRLYPSLTTP